MIIDQHGLYIEY